MGSILEKRYAFYGRGILWMKANRVIAFQPQPHSTPSAGLTSKFVTPRAPSTRHYLQSRSDMPPISADRFGANTMPRADLLGRQTHLQRPRNHARWLQR